MNTFPAELIIQIASVSNLTPADRASLAQTCKRFRDIVEPLIYHIVKMQYPFNESREKRFKAISRNGHWVRYFNPLASDCHFAAYNTRAVVYRYLYPIKQRLIGELHYRSLNLELSSASYFYDEYQRYDELRDPDNLRTEKITNLLSNFPNIITLRLTNQSHVPWKSYLKVVAVVLTTAYSLQRLLLGCHMQRSREYSQHDTEIAENIVQDATVSRLKYLRLVLSVDDDLHKSPTCNYSIRPLVRILERSAKTVVEFDARVDSTGWAPEFFATHQPLQDIFWDFPCLTKFSFFSDAFPRSPMSAISLEACAQVQILEFCANLCHIDGEKVKMCCFHLVYSSFADREYGIQMSQNLSPFKRVRSVKIWDKKLIGDAAERKGLPILHCVASSLDCVQKIEWCYRPQTQDFFYYRKKTTWEVERSFQNKVSIHKMLNDCSEAGAIPEF